MSNLDEAVKRLHGDVRLGELSGNDEGGHILDLRTVLDALAKYQRVAEAAKGIREELDEIVSGGWEELDAALADLEVLG